MRYFLIKWYQAGQPRTAPPACECGCHALPETVHAQVGDFCRCCGSRCHKSTYKDSEKHLSTGGKWVTKGGQLISPAPKNGELALENSVRYGSCSRIGVSEGQIVELKLTIAQGIPEYHGYVLRWEELQRPLRNFLEKNHLTDARGVVLEWIKKNI